MKAAPIKGRCMRSAQGGFSLVELLVAMLMGSLVVLAAGHLYLVTLGTFHDTRRLSYHHDTLVFVTTALLDDLRHASSITLSGDGQAVTLTRSAAATEACSGGSTVTRRYLLTASSGGHNLLMRRCPGPGGWLTSEPLVEGFHGSDGLHLDARGDGLYVLTLRLTSHHEQGFWEYVLRVQNRPAVWRARHPLSGGE